MIDHQNPTIKVLLQWEEISGCIVDSGSDVNVRSKATCTRVGITRSRSQVEGKRIPLVDTS